MANLNEIALVVANQLGRTNAEGSAITDLEPQIKAEIQNTIRFYNRRPMHLTEFRGGELVTVSGQTFYDTADITMGAGDQPLSGRTTIDVEDIIDIHYMRENPGDTGLNEPLSEIPYANFERLFEGAVPSGQPEFFTRYAGQIGIWPTPSGANNIYWSGIVRPTVPQADQDVSVWFDQANEMIEAGAARRVCSKYLRDENRANYFGQIEALQLQNLQSEHVRKSSTGRLRKHDVDKRRRY